MVRSLSLAAVGLALCATAPALAQTFELSPYFGVYAPLTNVVDEQGFEVRHVTAAAFGGRVTLWLPGRLGVEVTLMSAASDLEAEDNGTQLDCAFDFECDAWVLAASTKLLVRLGPLRGSSVHLGLGPSFLTRNGDGYEGAEGRSHFGGVFDAGARLRVGSRTFVRLDIEDYVGSTDFEIGVFQPFQTQSQTQHDVVFSLGLQFRLGL